MSRDENGAEMDGTDWCHIYFHIFYGSENEYRKSGNKYETRYCRKQIHTEYVTDTEEKWMITGNKGLLESSRKLKQFK
jgi:hypothetical protein